MVNDLATAVQNGFCSRQTASERNSEYSSVGEWERIVKEKKQEQQADLLYTIKTKQASTTETDGTNDGKTTEAA